MYRIEIKADNSDWGTIAEVETLEQAKNEIAHQKRMDKVQEEENEYRIIELKEFKIID